MLDIPPVLVFIVGALSALVTLGAGIADAKSQTAEWKASHPGSGEYTFRHWGGRAWVLIISSVLTLAAWVVTLLTL